MLRRFALYRVLRIASVAAPAIITYRWLALRERLGRPAAPETWERVHDRTARRLHDLGVELAGFFVKLCQIVGARADVFAAPFIRRLGRFHDAVPPRPFREVRGWIEYYDKDIIRITRATEPNLFIYKSRVKYLFEDPDARRNRS